jgi:hypothetical protein
MPRPRKIVLEVKPVEDNGGIVNGMENKPVEKKRRKRKVVEQTGIEKKTGDFYISFD